MRMLLIAPLLGSLSDTSTLTSFGPSSRLSIPSASSNRRTRSHALVEPLGTSKFELGLGRKFLEKGCLLGLVPDMILVRFQIF